MTVPIHPARLLQFTSVPRHPNMLNDLIGTDLTWGDLEVVWMRLASPGNTHLVPEIVNFLWKEANFLPQEHTFHRILAATVILAGPAYDPGSQEGPATQT